jgi:hypothetical protein
MANIDIPTALTNIYSYLVNGNVVKSHAFNPKSEYINGIDLEAQLKDVTEDLTKHLSNGIQETDSLVNVYRHAIVDLNLLRMVVLESTKALINETEGQLNFKSSSTANDYQLSMTGDHPLATHEGFISTLDHIKNFFNDPDTPKDLSRIMDVFNTFDPSKKIDFVSTIVGSKMKKRLSLWARLIKPTLPQMNDLEALKIVMKHLLGPSFQFKPTTKTMKQIKQQFYQFKNNLKTQYESSTSSAIQTVVKIKFAKDPAKQPYDYYLQTFEQKPSYNLTISLGQKKVKVRLTWAQSYLMSIFKDCIKVTKFENYGIGVIWGLLDSYIDFSSEKNIQRLLRAQQKKNIEYQKDDLLQDRLTSMKSTFRDLGVSFSGTAKFKPNCIVEKVELEDFSCLFEKIDSKMDGMYSQTVKTDRQELWNVIYGNLKSHLSNHRSASSLFHCF